MFFFFEDIPADAILELFGKTFFEFCQDSGYDKILQVLGARPKDFLQVKFIVNKFAEKVFFLSVQTFNGKQMEILFCCAIHCA